PQAAYANRKGRIGSTGGDDSAEPIHRIAGHLATKAQGQVDASRIAPADIPNAFLSERLLNIPNPRAQDRVQFHSQKEPHSGPPASAISLRRKKGSSYQVQCDGRGVL